MKNKYKKRRTNLGISFLVALLFFIYFSAVAVEEDMKGRVNLFPKEGAAFLLFGGGWPFFALYALSLPGIFCFFPGGVTYIVLDEIDRRNSK